MSLGRAHVLVAPGLSSSAFHKASSYTLSFPQLSTFCLLHFLPLFSFHLSTHSLPLTFSLISHLPPPPLMIYCTWGLRSLVLMQLFSAHFILVNPYTNPSFSLSHHSTSCLSHSDTTISALYFGVTSILLFSILRAIFSQLKGLFLVSWVLNGLHDKHTKQNGQSQDPHRSEKCGVCPFGGGVTLLSKICFQFNSLTFIQSY